MWQFIISATIVSLTAFIQTTNLVFINGLKPDLVLIVLAILAAIHKEWKIRTPLALIAIFILKFSPMINWMDVIFAATVFMAMSLVDYLPWKKLVNIIVSIMIGTIIINASAIISVVFIEELLLNLIISLIFFLVINNLYAKIIKTQKNRF